MYYCQLILILLTSRFLYSKFPSSYALKEVAIETKLNPFTLGNICLKVTLAFIGTSVGILLHAAKKSIFIFSYRHIFYEIFIPFEIICLYTANNCRIIIIYKTNFLMN